MEAQADLSPMSTAGDDRPSQPATANPNPPQEWTSMARSWISLTFQEGMLPTLPEFEAWFDSIAVDLPEDVKSKPRAQLFETLTATQSSPVKQEQAAVSTGNGKHWKFQRTDTWQPVYSWLESLNKDEAVNNDDIAEWLEKNPNIKEDLNSKHSRYHLTHYIKKCHLKILKKREMKKGSPRTSALISEKKTRKEVPTRHLIRHFSAALLTKVPKNSDLLLAKQNEAIEKFELLVELEQRLLSQFPKPGPAYS